MYYMSHPLSVRLNDATIARLGKHAQALSDLEAMNLARTERRAVVTSNLRDYRPLHADAITPGGPGHFGMIFISGTYRRTVPRGHHLPAALKGERFDSRVGRDV